MDHWFKVLVTFQFQLLIGPKGDTSVKCLRVYVGNGWRHDSGGQDNEWIGVGIMLHEGRISRTGGRNEDTLGRWWARSCSRSATSTFLGTDDNTDRLAPLGLWNMGKWDCDEVSCLWILELSGLRNEGMLGLVNTSSPDFSCFRYFALRFLNHTCKKGRQSLWNNSSNILFENNVILIT